MMCVRALGAALAYWGCAVVFDGVRGILSERAARRIRHGRDVSDCVTLALARCVSRLERALAGLEKVCAAVGD